MRTTAIDSIGSVQRRGPGSPGAAPHNGRYPSMTPSDVAPAGSHDESGPAEAALIDAVKAGDAAAFDELVGRHMRHAFAVAYRLLGQRQDAEDVVQEGFMAALLKIDTFERGRPFGPWLLRIVANRALKDRKSTRLNSSHSQMS